MKQPKQLTAKEIRKVVLEQMRVEIIDKQTRNEVYLDALKEERIDNGKVGTDSPLEIKTVQAIREREFSVLALEKDLKLIEGKLKEMDGKLQ